VYRNHETSVGTYCKQPRGHPTHTETVIPPEGLCLGYTQFTEAGEVAGKLRLKREDESIENELQRITNVEEHDIVPS